MSFTITLAPSSANRLAIPSPKPEPAPVTMATLFFSRMRFSFGRSRLSGARGARVKGGGYNELSLRREGGEKAGFLTQEIRMARNEGARARPWRWQIGGVLALALAVPATMAQTRPDERVVTRPDGTVVQPFVGE